VIKRREAIKDRECLPVNFLIARSRQLGEITRLYGRSKEGEIWGLTGVFKRCGGKET